MNTYDQLKENLSILFPDHQLASNGREFRINCPMCEREGYPDKGYHLYISIFESDKPPLYNCFRNSNHRGVLTKSFIEQYSAYPQYVDTDLLDLIRNQANRAAKLNRYRFNKNYGFKLINPIAKNDEKSMIKLGYINSRLGTNLTLEDMVSLKIVINLGEFIYNNRLRLTRSDKSVFALPCKLLAHADQSIIDWLICPFATTTKYLNATAFGCTVSELPYIWFESEALNDILTPFIPVPALAAPVAPED